MTRIPYAIWYPGPSWKRGYGGTMLRSLNAVEGEVKHSMEGEWPGVIDAVIENPDRQASWHFTILRDGKLYQHYEIEDICWHCGQPGDERRDTSLIGNITLVGEEHEGFAGEALTLAQIATTTQLTADIRRLCGITDPPTRP